MHIAILLLLSALTEPWEWTMEERVRARLAHVAATGKVDRSARPELVYPEDAFQSLVRIVFSSENGRAFRHGKSSIDILTTEEEWERLEEITRVYAEAFASGVRGPEICRLRNEALERARKEFGRVKFDRFLYRAHGGPSTSYGRRRPEASEENVAREIERLTKCVPRELNMFDADVDPVRTAEPRRGVSMTPCTDHRGNTPLMLDLGSGAYRMSTVEEGVSFDFDGDGIGTGTAWPSDPNAVAFLVHDRTWNGRIDNGTELFANATPLRKGGKSHGGLWYLQAWDCNKDGILTKDDCLWKKLALWFDKDRNGVAGANEYMSLDEAGVIALEPGKSDWVGRGDFNGNLTLNRGWFRLVVNGEETRRAMFEICLAGEPVTAPAAASGN